MNVSIVLTLDRGPHRVPAVQADERSRVRLADETRRGKKALMGDVIGVAVLLGVPFAVFIWSQWRREERDRKRQNRERSPQNPTGSKDSYWGGMGRPGR